MKSLIPNKISSFLKGATIDEGAEVAEKKYKPEKLISNNNSNYCTINFSNWVDAAKTDPDVTKSTCARLKLILGISAEHKHILFEKLGKKVSTNWTITTVNTSKIPYTSVVETWYRNLPILGPSKIGNFILLQ